MNDDTIINELETLPDDIFDNFDANTKCGEIFVTKGEFHYLCTFCGNTFLNLPIFSQHLFQNHQIFNFEPILNDATFTNLTKNKNYNNCNLLTPIQQQQQQQQQQIDLHSIITTTASTTSTSPSSTLENLIFNFDNQTNHNICNTNIIQSLINQVDDDELFIYQNSNGSIGDGPDHHDDNNLTELDKIKIQNLLKETDTINNNNNTSTNCNNPKLKRDNKKRTDEQIILRSLSIKPFKCEICNKGFCTGKNLLYHRKKCAERIIPFSCQFCPRKFFIRDKCERHEQSKHPTELNPDIPKGYWRCQICLKILSNSCGRKKHQDTHLLQTNGRHHIQLKRCSCKICGKQLSSSASLKVHMRIHNEENRFKCNYCTSAFKFSTSLKTHELSHTGERQFSCRYCSKTFLQKSHRQNHELLHAKEKKYECNDCGMRFHRTDYLNSHIKNKHTVRKDENRPYQCKYCSSAFTAEKYLKNHQRLHENGIEYQCKYCERKSVVKGIIERHERTHFKSKEYFDCELCPKKFESRNGLVSHQRNKHPNNTLIEFKCGKCEEIFDTESNLQQHIRKICNITVKCYPCNMCSARFDNEHGMKVHKAVAHITQQQQNIIENNISSLL